MVNQVQFIIWLVHFSLYIVKFLMEECCAYFHNLFWHCPGSMRNHSFFFPVVELNVCLALTEIQHGQKPGRIFFQKTTLFLGTKGDEMLSETNLEWPGFVWLRTKFRICCHTQNLAVVTQFFYFYFRAVSKSRWFLTLVTTEKLLCGFFSCWKENAILTSTILEC